MADRWPEGEAIGGLLARVRVEHGKSQYTLAHALAEVSRNPSVTRDYVSRWESGRRVPTPYWRQHLSAALGIPADVLDKAAATAKHNRAAVPPGTRRPSTPDHGDMLARAVRMSWPGVRLSRPLPGYGVDWHIELPGGRVIDGGGCAAVQAHPLRTAADGSAFLAFASDLHLGQFMATTHRGMLIGIDVQAEPPRLRGLSLQEARRKLTLTPGARPAVVIPRAYELDDLTCGVIWALANADDALLADDHALDQRCKELRAYEQLPRSAVSRQAAAGLSSVAQMWLGSSFCARHILRNLAAATRLPVFWTREQRGEEASAWLLFRHKYAYLKDTSAQFANSTEPLIRAFCIPETTVSASPRWERILLFLSLALMESLGIRIEVCAEPEYSAVDGFALMPGDRAVIATWVRGEGVWYVDATSGASVLRDFGDVAGHAHAHSVTEAPTPARRLMELADYLGLEWAWLRHRCAELGAHGCAGLISPRSRLLSIEALDAVLRYVGALGRSGHG